MKVMILSFSKDSISTEAWQFAPKNPIGINSHCRLSVPTLTEMFRTFKGKSSPESLEA